MNIDSKKVRVLVTDDSDFQRGMIVGILESDPEIEVIGCAVNGQEAVEKSLKLKPDVITMDMKMPVMDGMEAIKEIMAKRPTPILVVSATILEEQKFAFTCLEIGALDFVPVIPAIGIVAEDLITKIKICSKIKVVSHPYRKRPSVITPPFKKRQEYAIVGIAVSTGGPAALAMVLSRLPRKFPLPIVITQHISEGFTRSLAEWLDDRCKIKVVEAEDAEKLEEGTAYLAPDGLNLIVDKKKKAALLKEDFSGSQYKPSADAMFKSMTEVYGPGVIGIIMTGMGKDGAAGIKAIKKAGGFTIAQDKASSAIYGMNRAAIEENSVIEVLSLGRIADRLVELVS